MIKNKQNKQQVLKNTRIYLLPGQGVREARVRCKGQYRKQLSYLFVRSQSSCLLSRMGHLGEGEKECAARRRVAMAVDEERRKRKAEGFFAAHVRGHGSTPIISFLGRL